jgi:spore maturation protein CgeB
MRLVVFGLAVSSSWGNGHATQWRGLIASLASRGHSVTFYERDVPWYAAHRDLTTLPGGELVLYRDWSEAVTRARRDVASADAVIVTSYCPDALAASALAFDSPSATSVFYDLDAPVTLDRLDRGEDVPYVPPEGLGDFDLVLSFTGGPTLELLRSRLGARRAVALPGCVDPAIHARRPSSARPRHALSYLGTWAQDREAALDALFFGPARALPERRFLLGGAQYPDTSRWPRNVEHVQHVPPPEHGAFYASARLTLNVTRRVMARLGHCPSARIFEAAACGTPVLSDWWEGLDAFFAPGLEILVARTSAEASELLSLSDAELARIAEAARERMLASHTAERRAAELLSLLELPVGILGLLPANQPVRHTSASAGEPFGVP